MTSDSNIELIHKLNKEMEILDTQNSKLTMEKHELQKKIIELDNRIGRIRSELS